MRHRHELLGIAVGGVVAGALDIAYAIAFWAYRGVSPTRVLQSVASGLLGAGAFEGGRATAALGLGLHFLIALTIAAVFSVASLRAMVLVRHPWIAGASYGVVVYFVMNAVVLPLSAFPRAVSWAPLVVSTGLLVHLLFIGVPIALAVRWARRGRVANPTR